MDPFPSSLRETLLFCGVALALALEGVRLLPAAPLAAVCEPTVLAQSQLVRLLMAPPSLGFGFGLSRTSARSNQW